MKAALSFAVVLAVVCGGVATAEPITVSLSDLIDGDMRYIISGDKLFDQFEYYAVGDMPTAAGVNVTPIMDACGNYGISFHGGFIDLFGNGPSDALIRYRVTVLDPEQWISDAHICGNPLAVGDAVAQVTETFLPDVYDQSMSIGAVAPDGPPKLRDMMYFDDLYKVLHVQKDIIAYAKTAGSYASISFVDQTFSQVPEPSTLVSLAMGLLCAACLLRRNRR